ncbi:MAG: acyl-CoA dehydrogenase family protein, partial [Pseudoclavibacter sp.]
GPQIGIAEAIFDRVLEKSTSKGIAYTGFQPQATSTAVQLRLAKARLDIDAAINFAIEAGNILESYAAERTFPDVETRSRIRAMTGWISEHLQAAVESLLTVHGSGAFAEVNPLQRQWRDLNIAGRHALILPDVGYELYGRAMTGQPTDAVTPLV